MLCALLTPAYLFFYSLKFLDCHILYFSYFFQLGKYLFYMHIIWVIFPLRNLLFPIKWHQIYFIFLGIYLIEWWSLIIVRWLVWTGLIIIRGDEKMKDPTQVSFLFNLSMFPPSIFPTSGIKVNDSSLWPAQMSTI